VRRLVRAARPARCVWSFWLAAGVSFVAANVQAQAYYRFATPAPWVEVVDAEPAPAASPPRADSVETLLFDRQFNVTSAGDDYYQRLVTRVLNPTGVDEYSQVDLAVDPTFQSLDLHWLRIIRDGVVLDQQATARITELPQETDLRNRVYNGRYTINVLLSDVRPGDVVDYAFSLQSRNSLFPEHFYTRVDLGWSTPVARQRVRIVSPTARALRYRMSDGSPVPQPVSRDGTSELLLDTRDVNGVAADDAVPGWYSVWPFLEAGDLHEWGDVVRRTIPLYRDRSRGGALVDEVIAAIRAEGGSLEEQALRALQWVQEEIRYTSISIGRGSHQPTEPNVVIERRFGDCKDKSLLLVAILEALGIEADVALVNTWRGRALDETLPSPYAFDHAIVRALVGSSEHWLDPTGYTQYSPLNVEHSPDFARALVLSETVDGLQIIPKPGPDMRRRAVAVVLDARKGLEAPATLDITTQYSGALADTMRTLFASGTREQRETDYTSYAARYYTTAKMRAPLAFDDDRERNVLEVREQYSLDSAFIANDEGVLELVLHPDEVYNYAEPLGAGSRRAPLALEYPIDLSQSIVVHLPDEWRVAEEETVVDNPVFHYRGSARYSARTLQLAYEYRALDDHVPAGDLARYEADRARVYADLGYSLTFDPTLESGIPTAVAPLPMIVLLLSLAGSIWAAVTIGWRYDPEPRPVAADAPVGIAGWLLLPCLGVLITPFVLGWLVLQWLPFIGAAQWAVLPDLVSEAYRSSAQTVVLAMLAVCVGFTVASALVLVLFFCKRTSTPNLYIALEWTVSAVVLAFMIWAIASGLDSETNPAGLTAETIRDLIGSAIWTAYMLSSRRVAATFVGRRRQGLLPAPREAVASS
jgi:transglutaminase-like putative cysteine protease